jgi:hypothetical protein
MHAVPARSHRSRRALIALALGVPLVAAMPGAAVAHDKGLDHPAPGSSPLTVPLSGAVNSGGPGADWEPIATIPTGNPHTDIEFFDKAVEPGGPVETFAAVGTLAAGGNGGGQSIVQLTSTNAEGEQEVDPSFFSAHPSATCVTDPESALGLQHDVEATPKGAGLNNGSYLPPGVTGEAQLVIDATDNEGRCHDQGEVSNRLGAPKGGLELIDISDIGDPVEIGLTSHIGESHTVNTDPKRPHIAYSVTSDSVTVGKDTKDLDKDGDVEELVRLNEDPASAQRFNLDGFEVVDLSSCMTAPFGTLAVAATERNAAVDEKRAECRPEVYRYRYDTLAMSLGHTTQNAVYGCHELEIYPNDQLTCAGGAALLVFDMAGAFDDNGTPSNFLDDKPKGTPLPCTLRESSTLTPGFGTGAMVTDCVDGTGEGTDDLTVAKWLASGKPSLEGVEHVGSVFHQGRGGPLPATQDIDFNHEAEYTQSGEFLLATDERGGGVTQGAQCTAGNPIAITNGGVSAYPANRLRQDEDRPETAEEALAAYAVGTDGKKAIFRAPIRTGAEGTFCTAHVMQQIPGQNRIVMGWYRQGTQVVDYVELPDGVLEWVENQAAQMETPGSDTTPATRSQRATQQAGFFIPENANQWVSHIFKADDNGDGTVTYFGATGDFGRQAIDVYKVTLPKAATACTLAPEATLSDRDAAREVHRPSIDCVLHYAIAKGTGADTYTPERAVTRGQMASFVLNAINAAGSGAVLPAATGADRFSDLGTDPTHRASINKLAQLGIIQGTGGGRFNPLGTITREQMATFVTQAARFVSDEDITASADHFTDEGTTHAANINAGFERGFFSGTTAPKGDVKGQFSPGVVVQRDQMASFLTNLFTRTITQDELTGRPTL